jgi:hypothetical protein
LIFVVEIISSILQIFQFFHYYLIITDNIQYIILSSILFSIFIMNQLIMLIIFNLILDNLFLYKIFQFYTTTLDKYFILPFIEILKNYLI